MDDFTYCYYIIFASICQRGSAIFKKFMVITNVFPLDFGERGKEDPPRRCGAGEGNPIIPERYGRRSTSR